MDLAEEPVRLGVGLVIIASRLVGGIEVFGEKWREERDGGAGSATGTDCEGLESGDHNLMARLVVGHGRDLVKDNGL